MAEKRIAPIKASSVRSKRRRRKNLTIHLPFAYRVKRKNLLAFLAVVILALLLGVLLFWDIAFEYRTETPGAEETGLVARSSGIPERLTSTPGSTDQPSSESPEKSTPVPVSTVQPVHGVSKASKTKEKVNDRILEKMLGELRETTGLNGTKSLLLLGTYEENERIFDMKLAAKMPGSVRKTLRDEALEIICRYDGADASIEVKQKAGLTVQRPLKETVYREALMLEGAFLRLGDHGKGNPSPRYTRGANQNYEGRVCWSVISDGEGRAPIRHLIEIENGLERARYLNMEINGAERRLSIRFSDFRTVDGYPFPHAYTLEVDGEVHGIARIERVQRNAGLMPWMFGQKP